jgi:hypothetical protein
MIPLARDVPTPPNNHLYQLTDLEPFLYSNSPVTIAPSTLPRATPMMVSNSVTGAEQRLLAKRKYTNRTRIAMDPTAMPVRIVNHESRKIRLALDIPIG